MHLTWFWAALSSAYLQICLYQVMTTSLSTVSKEALVARNPWFPIWNCSECKLKEQSIQELHFYASCYNIRDSNSAESLLQLPGNACLWMLAINCLLQVLWQLEEFQEEGNFQLQAAWKIPVLVSPLEKLLFIVTLSAITTGWVKNKTHHHTGAAICLCETFTWCIKHSRRYSLHANRF